MKVTFSLIIQVCLIYTLIQLFTGCASTTPLIKASKEGDSLAVQKLIDGGANINEPDSRGYNALFYAVEYGQLEVVKSLISKGANIESKDVNGMTPIIFAAHYNYDPPNADIIKLLIKSGADINAKSPEGETVLDFALSSAQGDILDDLIKTRRINLWVSETGKARIFFVCSDLYDHIKVTVGKQSKKLNPNRSDGVVFIDVDTGKHIIDANYDQYVSQNRTSIDVIEGQTYYFRVTQNMRNRALGYAMFSSALVDKITSTNSFPITILKESEAQHEIKEILKSKELNEAKKSNISESAEITKHNNLKKTDVEVKQSSSDPSGYAQKLRELKKLKDEGLLTDREYELKRKIIVDGL